MTLPPVRLTWLLAAASLVAACGGSKPEPVAPPEPVLEAPADDTAPATGEPDADDETGTSGAAAHVHGLADLAITREGSRVLGELISPMANFGLAETDAEFTDVVTAELSGLVELDGGECEADVPQPSTDNTGAHTDAVVHFSWTCAKPEEVGLVRFAGFEAFPSFETVTIIYITGAGQKVGKLTPDAAELSLK